MQTHVVRVRHLWQADLVALCLVQDGAAHMACGSLQTTVDTDRVPAVFVQNVPDFDYQTL